MRKSDHDIDNLFSSHFEEFEVSVSDKESLWRKINPDRSSRRFLFFMFFGVVLTSCLMIAWTVDEIEYNKGAAGGGSDESTVKTLYIDKEQDSQGQSNEELTERIEAILEKADNEIDLKKVEKNRAKNFPISSEPNAVQKANQRNSDSRGKELQGNGRESRGLTKGAIAGLDKHQAKDGEVEGEMTGQHSSDESPIVTLAQQEADNLVEVESEPFLRKQDLYLSELSTHSIKDLDGQRTLLDELSKNKLVCSTTGRAVAGSGHFFVDVYGNLSLPIDHVSLQSGSEDQLDYLSLWNDRYQSLSSFAGGLMVGYSMNNGLEISAGGEYQRIESQYQTTQRVTEIIRVYDPMAYFFTDDDGNTVWVADSVSAVSVYDRTTSVANRSSLISVPFQLSYPVFQKGTWQIRAVGGGAFNFSLDHKGQHLRSNQQLVQLDDDNVGNFIAPRIGLSIEAGLQIGTFVGDRVELYASPRYRYNRQSYLVGSEALSVARDFVGIRVGAKYHLD